MSLKKPKCPLKLGRRSAAILNYNEDLNVLVLVGVCRTPMWSIRPFYKTQNLSWFCANHVMSWLWCKKLNVTEKTSQEWRHIFIWRPVFADSIILWINHLICVCSTLISSFTTWLKQTSVKATCCGWQLLHMEMRGEGSRISINRSKSTKATMFLFVGLHFTFSDLKCGNRGEKQKRFFGSKCIIVRQNYLHQWHVMKFHTKCRLKIWVYA